MKARQLFAAFICWCLLVFVASADMAKAEDAYKTPEGALKVYFWKEKMTPDIKTAWVMGYRDAWPTAELSLYNQAGFENAEAVSLVNGSRFMKCTVPKSNDQLVAMFDKWVLQHPEVWDGTLRTEFVLAITSKEYCP